MPKSVSTRSAYKMLTCIYLCRTLLFFAPYADFFLKNIINIILFLFFTLPHQSFSKNILHLSGYMIKHCHTTYYGLKDKRVIFQLSFMTENDKTFCAKLFIVLSQTFYHSAENELKHG